MDDGSTDATSIIARTFEARFQKMLRVIEQENRGACAARNRALKLAGGEYIQYLDADDVLHPEKIERQVRQLTREPAGTIATGPWVRFRSELPVSTAASRAPDWRDFDPAVGWLIQSLSGQGTMPNFAWLIPRSIAEAAGPWNERLLLNQDGEYFTRVVVQASRIVFCDGACGYYRSGLRGSISRTRTDGALRSLFDAYCLCEATLLKYVNNTETRRACAGMWQQYLFTAYPQVPDLIRQAEEKIAHYGGMYRTPGVSRPLRVVRDLLGWKIGLRLQRLYVASGLQAFCGSLRS